MSISTFQEKLVKGGCGLAVLSVCAAIMLGGVFYTSCITTQRPGQSEAADKVALEVGGTQIREQELSNAVDGQKAYQQQFMPGSLTPEAELGIYQKVVEDAVDNAAKAALVHSSGIPITDDLLLKAATETLDSGLDAARDQLVKDNNLKPGASDEEFAKAFKNSPQGGGKTPAEVKKESLDQVSKVLADKDKREGLVMGLAKVILQDQAIAKLNLSDADLEKYYSTYSVKRIITKDLVPGKAKPEERIAKADAALKSGSTFEKAIDDYSEDLPTPGKKLSDVTTSLTGFTLLSDPSFKPLLALKAGDVSPVIKLPEGQAIYKIVSIKTDLPKEFATRKAFYKNQALHELTDKDVDAMIAQYKSSPGNVKFTSPGYKLVYDYQQAQNGVSTAGKDLSQEMQALADEAKKVAGEAGPDAHPATLVRYGALNFLWNTPGTDKTKLRDDMVDTLKAILDRSEVFSVRMKLVDVYVDGKQYTDAVAALVEAAKMNRTDPAGTLNNTQITEKVKRMVADKQISAEEQKTVEAAQYEWKKLFDEEQKDRDEVAKARKAEEDAEKAAEEKAKKEEAAKNPAKPSTTTPPTGTPPSKNAPTKPTPGSAKN